MICTTSKVSVSILTTVPTSALSATSRCGVYVPFWLRFDTKRYRPSAVIALPWGSTIPGPVARRVTVHPSVSTSTTASSSLAPKYTRDPSGANTGCHGCVPTSTSVSSSRSGDAASKTRSFPVSCAVATRWRRSGDSANCTKVCAGPSTSASSMSPEPPSTSATRFSTSEAAKMRLASGSMARACGRGKNTSSSSTLMSSRTIAPMRCGGFTAIIERPTYSMSVAGSTVSSPGVSKGARPTRSPSALKRRTLPPPISDTYQWRPSGSTAVSCGRQLGSKPRAVMSIVRITSPEPASMMETLAAAWLAT